MKNYSHITGLPERNQEVKNFINDVLIPGLKNYLDENERVTEFVSYIHSLGVSAEFVTRIMEKNSLLENAISMAIETCYFRLLNFPSQYTDTFAYIDSLKFVFYKGDRKPIRDTIVVFKPHDMSREDALVALDIELKKREEEQNNAIENEIEN